MDGRLAGRPVLKPLNAVTFTASIENNDLIAMDR